MTSTDNRQKILREQLRGYMQCMEGAPSSAQAGRKECTVELGNDIANADIDYWVFGHSHRNIEAQIGNTRVTSNQLGYGALQRSDGANISQNLYAKTQLWQK